MRSLRSSRRTPLARVPSLSWPWAPRRRRTAYDPFGPGLVCDSMPCHVGTPEASPPPMVTARSSRIMVLIVGAQGVRCGARLDLLGSHQTFGDGELFERLEPALIITRRHALLLCRGSL